MSDEIKKIAVLGAGVMGSGIAAHIANAGVEVLLLDVKTEFAIAAIDKLLKTNPAAFVLPDKAKLIEVGNFNDDLAKLKDCDWVIEVVLEDIKIKAEIYQKISEHIKKDTVVSSNTSTLPLALLTKNMPQTIKQNFMITHFFNPPRYMRLLEIVTTAETDKKLTEKIKNFADMKLGKSVVNCKDTPGFIANRIGMYWLMSGLLNGFELNIAPEDADGAMSGVFGLPKTGIFGLFDLVGIDLMPLIAQAMLASLPKDDPFVKLYKLPPQVEEMIKQGYTGRKGKGGFYRLDTSGGRKVKQARNLASGEYKDAKKPNIPTSLKSREFSKIGEGGDAVALYALKVMSDMFYYSTLLVEEIADNIADIDKAICMGYNWKLGPFEMIDSFGSNDICGSDILIAILNNRKIEIPKFLQTATGKKFYRERNGKKQYLTIDGDYKNIEQPLGILRLEDIKLSQKPIAKTASAKLWDIGDGIACLEFTSKANSLDPEIMRLIEKITDDMPNAEFQGLIIGGDGDNFSVGANLGFFLYGLNVAAWNMVSKSVRQGQEAYMKLKYAKFPVVGAMHGMTLGGGLEACLHCDAIQAHVESYAGLVEVGVGLIPGWGGCKEMIWRNYLHKPQAGAMPAIAKAFENISLAKIAKSAHEAKRMGFLNKQSRITMNRDRLLADAKELCLSLVENYQPPEEKKINLPGKSGYLALSMAIDNFVNNGKATSYDEVVSKKLAEVLSGGDGDITAEVSEQDLLDLEHEIFMSLVKNEGSVARMEHMMVKGKPLRN